MQIKEFKILARKFLDINGFEHVGIRFMSGVNPAALTVDSRDQCDTWFYSINGRATFYPENSSEYPTVIFSKPFIGRCNMSQALKIILHELGHLKRGVNKTGEYVMAGRYAGEMDPNHDLEWMKEMWKMGYSGQPKFDNDLRSVLHKLEEVNK